MRRQLLLPAWREAARGRRTALCLLVTAQTVIGVGSIVETLPYQGYARFEFALIILFALLFAWISLGFWTAVVGFFVLWHARDPFDLTGAADPEESGIRGRTAVLMPIYNEDVDRAFAGLQATYSSLKKTGRLEHFDFFILSDSQEIDKWIEEEIAWNALCRAVDGYDRIFYRHRRQNIRRKSGNIADFCRRWGSNYDHMVVLDADSAMEGDTIVRLVRLMERHPRAGLIQTVSLAANQTSLLGRIQQFANQVYTPLFAAGMHFWSLGESPYWGHNAIIRVEAFMKHCALPRLPGSPPLGGEILSHDFVEAALLGRAGWETWLAYTLPGSYEETPPTLHDELKRDQRWCQGNLQHARLLLARGIRPGHRAVFATGIVTYVSALLWLVFLLLSTGELALQALFERDYFSGGPSLFPIWPRWRPDVAVALLGTTLFMLFAPKFLALALIVKTGAQRSFGGGAALGASVVLEALTSALLAPIRMFYHSRFVLSALLGRSIRWSAQRRGEGQIGYIEAIRQQAWLTCLAMAWAAGIYWINPLALWLLAPVLLGAILAIPIAVYSSRSTLGLAARRCGLFLIPEEIGAKESIVTHKQNLLASRKRNASPFESLDGLERVLRDPHANAIHVALLRRALGGVSVTIRQLQEKVLCEGTESLSPVEKKRLLLNPTALVELHLMITREASGPPASTRSFEL
ncbi:MAG TPA: glucans biosynthesis glucosyltransferase MdoH [Candidatus Eisenbacteria bacterium]|nr:glucans biosynthesis glucosyltransferase MdoH [Candidatus Eisenbacteria bacterium]